MENQSSAVSDIGEINKICSCLEQTFQLAADLSEIMDSEYEARVASSRVIAYNPSCESVRPILKESVQAVDLLRQKIDDLVSIISKQNDQNLLLQIGRCYCALGDFPNSYASYITVYRTNMQLFENCDWYILGSLHQHFTAYHEAMESFSHVDTKKMSLPMLQDYTLRKAILSRQLALYDQSISLFNQILDAPPWGLTSDDIRMQIGLTNYRAKKIPLAYQQFTTLLNDHPNNRMCIRQHSIITLLTTATEDLRTILPKIQENLARCPDHHIQLVIALIYYLLSDYVNSYDYFKNSLEYWSNHPSFWIALGSLYYKNSQLDDAAIAFQRAIYTNQTSTTAWLNLGFIFEEKNKPDDARTIYVAGQKQCKSDKFALRMNKQVKSEIIDVKDEELLEQVPEEAAKTYIQMIPYIDGESVGLPGVSLESFKTYPPSLFSPCYEIGAEE